MIHLLKNLVLIFVPVGTEQDIGWAIGVRVETRLGWSIFWAAEQNEDEYLNKPESL